MLLVLINAGLFSTLSIFAFFGPAVIGTFETGPNMFDLVFGSNGFNSYPGMVTLFILEILVILLAICGIISIVLSHKGKTKRNYFLYCIIAMAAINVINAVLSFCTLFLTNLAGDGNVLGFGPILFGALQLMSALILSTLFLAIKNARKVQNARSNFFGNSQSREQHSFQPSDLSEREKMELIEGYKRLYEQGTITEEEFESKKKQLLK